MKILLIILISTILMGDTFENRFTYTNLSGNFSNSKQQENLNTYKASYNPRYIRNTKNYMVNLEAEIFHLGQELDNVRNVSIAYEKQTDITLYTAMFGLKYNDVSLYTGYIPFKGGKFADIKNNSNNNGNGIDLIVNQSLLSTFIRYNYNDINFITGYARFEKCNNYNGLHISNDGSDGIFSIINYQTDNHYLELNYFNIDPVQKKDPDYNLGKIDLFGIGYIYTDYNNNFTVSAEVGYSRIDEQISDATASYAPGVPSSYLQSMGYRTESKKTSGSAYKLNVRYDFEIQDNDAFIGIEYFNTRSGFISMNHGTLFRSNYSYWQNRDAEQVTVFYNYEITPDFSINVNASISKSKQVPAYFSVAQTIDIDKTPNGYDQFYTTNKKLYTTLEFKF